jgi:hypothetical protein
MICISWVESRGWLGAVASSRPAVDWVLGLGAGCVLPSFESVLFGTRDGSWAIRSLKK